MQFEQLLNLASALRPDLPPEELYELTVLGLAELSGYKTVGLWLHLSNSPELTLVAATGVDGPELRALSSATLTSRIIDAMRDTATRLGEAIWWSHTGPLPWSGSTPITSAAPNGHSLLLPLVYTDTIGVVIFADSAPAPVSSEVVFISRCVDQVTMALTAARMVAENARTNAELRQALDNRQALLDTIAELSTPVLPLHQGVLLLPLVSSVDELRMQRISEALLNEVSRQSAKVVLLDVTGVPIIDTQVAGDMLRLEQAVRLLGGRTIIVGIRPEIAQTLVSLGVDVSKMTPRATLAEGLVVALEMLELRLVKREKKQRERLEAISPDPVRSTESVS